MTPRDLRNIHTARNSCRDALPCTKMTRKLPQYFYLLMEKPVCTLSVYTKPNFCSSATKLLKLLYTPLNVFVDKCIAKYINSLQYIITIYYTNSSLQHFQGWFFAHEKNDWIGWTEWIDLKKLLMIRNCFYWYMHHCC